MALTANEARVIGCLLEKEKTTPEQYPLSLNALTLACNQKSSRDPVMALDESQVQETIDSLSKKRLVADQTGFGSRVTKYTHRFCNTEFSALQLTAGQVAIICLLLLRGPQTAGELRTRSNRLHPFNDVAEVDSALEQLASLETPLVKQLPREPGKRESRFTELVSEVGQAQQTAPSSPAATTTPHADDTLAARVSALEVEVAELKSQLQQLLE
ncbi:YceH family protein [Shewanella waksmanii]|uniref:YceH family protein n=1 Tax=Shewanella waksmanii TaxID=213783 RepID=UPI003734E86D